LCYPKESISDYSSPFLIPGENFFPPELERMMPDSILYQIILYALVTYSIKFIIVDI